MEDNSVRRHRVHILLIGILPLIVVILLILLFGWLRFIASNDEPDPGQSNLSQPVNEVSLEELMSLPSSPLPIGAVNQLVVNGELKANQAFVITPGQEPLDPSRGQIYYDSGLERFRYFDGSQFLTLAYETDELTVCYIGGDCGFLTIDDLPDSVTLPATVNVANLTANGVLLGNGTGPIQATAAPTPGQILVGSSGGAPVFRSVGGDITISPTGSVALASDSVGPAELAVSGVTPGTYGDGAEYPIFTVDADGRITSASTLTLPGGAAAPNDAQYLTLALSGGLSAERLLVAGDGLSSTDGGANGNLTLDVIVDGSTIDFNISNQLSVPTGGITTTQIADLTVGTIDIAADAVTLGTKTSGNYVATISNGSGISGSSATEGGTPTLSLGNLTANWQQTGAFDIVLDNAGSELQIRGSVGAFYATLDVGALTGDETFNLAAGTAGDICTTAGNCVGSGGGSAPQDAQYLTLALNGNLSAERVLTPGSSIAITDGGANGNYDINTIQDIRTTASPTFASPTFTGTLAVQGASVTVGGAAQLGQLILNDGSLNTVSLVPAAHGQDTTLTIPDATGVSDTFCLQTLGNCAGTAQNVFTTIDAPNGTDPVADNSADTLLLVDGSNITITGDSTADSVTVAVVASPTFSGSLTVEGDTTLGNASADIITLNGTIAGATPLIFEGATPDTFQTVFAVTDPTADNTLTFPDLSGEISVLGQTIETGEITNLTILGEDIANDTIALGTKTSGNYVATISNGSGISGSSATEGGTPTLSLGNLTANWIQGGAFDLVLDHASSELRIMESVGDTFYATFDVGDLSNDAVISVPGAVSATDTFCLLTLNNCASAGQTYTDGTNTVNNAGQLTFNNFFTVGGTTPNATVTITDDILDFGQLSDSLNLDATTSIGLGNSFALNLVSDLSGGDRTVSALSITQANHATNNQAGAVDTALLEVINQDAASTTRPLVFFKQVTDGIGLNIDQGGFGGTALLVTNSGSDFNGTGIDIDLSEHHSGEAIRISRLVDTAVGLDIEEAAGLTGGQAISISGSELNNGSFTGDVIRVNPSRTASSGTLADTGSFLNIARANTTTGAILTISGDLARLQSNCTQTSGTCTDTSNILELNQQYAAATGAVLNILNSGSGAGILFEAGTTVADGIQFGTDANSVNLYRSANDTLRTDDSLSVGGNGTIVGTLAVQGAFVTVGGAAQLGQLILNDGSSNTVTLSPAAHGQDTTLTIPDATGASDTFCLLTLGNCAGGSNIWTDGGTFTYTTNGEDVVLGGTSTATADIWLQANGAAVFNEQGNNVDFRVESDALANGLFYDASNDALSINTATNTFTSGLWGAHPVQLFVDNKNIGGLDTALVVSNDSSVADHSNGIYGLKTINGGVVDSNTELWELIGFGYDGGDYEPGAIIRMLTDGGVATAGDTTDLPGRIEFLTTPDGSNVPLVRLSIRQNGDVEVGTSTAAGVLRVADGSLHFASIVSGNQSADRSITIPVTAGNDTFCLLTLGNCAGGSNIWTDGGTFTYTTNGEDVVLGGTSTATADIWLQATGAAIFNEQGADADFRVEGVGQVNALFVQGSDGFIGIGNNNPQQRLHVIDGFRVSDSVNADWLDILTDGSTVNINTTDALYVNHNVNQDIYLASGTSTGRVGIGTNAPDGMLEISGNRSQAAWGTNGIQLQASSSTYTDTSTAASGTAASAVFNSFATPTLAATNLSVTTTDAATVYIQGAPTAGTNQTITNAYALWVDGGTVRFDDSVGINVTDPEQSLHVDGNILTSGNLMLRGPDASTAVEVNSITFQTDASTPYWNFTKRGEANSTEPDWLRFYYFNGSSFINSLAFQTDGTLLLSETAANVVIGVSDSGGDGVLTIAGAGTGSSEGGQLTLGLAADYDTVFDNYNIDAFEDDFRIHNNGSTRFLISGIDGSITQRVFADSATAFLVQDAGGQNYLTVDTTNLQVAIGAGTDDVTFVLDAFNTAPGSAPDGAMFYDADDDVFRCRVSGAWINCDTTGGGGEVNRVTLYPEYAGGTLFADGSNNNGTLSASYDSTDRHNFYNWTASNPTTLQDYDIVIHTTVPSNFATANNTSWFIYGLANSTSSANNEISVSVFEGATACNTTDNLLADGDITVANTWTEVNLGSMAGCTFNANDTIRIQIKLSSLNNNNVQIGAIRWDYDN